MQLITINLWQIQLNIGSMLHEKSKTLDNMDSMDNAFYTNTELRNVVATVEI